MNYLADYERYLKTRNYSGQTVVHYINDLGLLQKYTEKLWGEVDKADVARFVQEQVKQGFCAKTINRRLYVIKGFYRYLIEELDLKVKNPVSSSQFIRRPRRLPKNLENKDIKQLFEVITNIRDKAIFSLMLRCGLRVGEVANLERDNVNILRHELRFIGKGNKERVVPIPDEILNMLIECVKIRPEWAPKFFWNKKHSLESIKINSIQRLLKRYAKKAGIEDIHCHMLRHSFACQMIENGMDQTVLRDLMGHSSISSTDVYSKVSDPFVKESYFKAMEKILATQED